tara:strand:+ start:276 stop:380 length:105 start_codon:yes stop_codon:yes gene_type:complete
LEVTSSDNKKKLFQFREAMYPKNPIEKNALTKNK